MRAPKAACDRTWQVEAVADGRLSGLDRASFERHLDTCEACRFERAQLERLHELAKRLPAEQSTPLRRRYLHNELLRRANERALGKDRAHFSRRAWGGITAAFACAALAAFVGFSRWTPAPATTTPPDEPRFSVVASAGGRWHTLERGRALRLAVGAGRFAMSVKKLHAAQRFVVELPDGELEVRGTRFELVVGTKTLNVAVSEGLVALRLRGQPEHALAAGDAWPSPAIPAPPAATEAAVPPAAPAPAPPRSQRGDPARVTAASPRRLPAPPAASVDEPQTELTAASEFARAMGAFSRGDFATAEQHFIDFEAHHPTSAHVEDTVFLRAVGRMRRGDEASARALAREYLRRYPAGFRAQEARRMAE